MEELVLEEETNDLDTTTTSETAFKSEDSDKQVSTTNLNTPTMFHNIPCKINYSGPIKSDTFLLVTKSLFFLYIP